MKTKTKTRHRSTTSAGDPLPPGLQWLETQLAPLAAHCPWTKTNPAECPLSAVRELPPAEVARWLRGLSAQEKEYLVLYHQCCLAIRWENEQANADGVAAAEARPAKRQTAATAGSRSRR